MVVAVFMIDIDHRVSIGSIAGMNICLYDLTYFKLVPQYL